MKDTCSIVNVLARSKAASILGIDAAVATAIFLDLETLDTAPNGHTSFLMKHFEEKYKGNTVKVYHAMAILAQRAKENPELIKWNELSNLDVNINLEDPAYEYVVVSWKPRVIGDTLYLPEYTKKWAVTGNGYAALNKVNYSPSKNYYLIAYNKNAQISIDRGITIEKDFKIQSAEDAFGLEENPITKTEAIRTVIEKIKGTKGLNIQSSYGTEYGDTIFDLLDASEGTYTAEMQEILDNAPRNKEGKLLAPNKEVTNLSDREYALVRTKAFKEWFGDWENDPENASKIVDENGEPKKLYHGTDKTFDKFQLDIEGIRGKNLVHDPHSIFFTDTYEKAFKYKHKYVMPVFLNVKNPITIDSSEHLDKTTEELIAMENAAILDPNYDGCIFNRIDKESEQGQFTMQWVAKNPLQIKSVYNTGRFYPNNRDIYSLEDNFEQIYGVTYKNTIYLNQNAVYSLDTPIHEYTHLWAKAMQYNNPTGWNSVVKLLQQTLEWDSVKNELSEKYNRIVDNNLVASEILARYSGERNAYKLQQIPKTRWGKLMQALKKFWNWVGQYLFDIKRFKSINEVTDRVIYDLLNQTDLKLPSEPVIDQRYFDITPDLSASQINLNGALARGGIDRNGEKYVRIANDVTIDKFFNYITGNGKFATSILKQRVFNRLQEDGYTLEYLLELINSEQDVIDFLTYHELSHLKREHLTHLRAAGIATNDILNPEMINIEYEATLDAIQTLQYKKYIAAQEYLTKSSVAYDLSKDKDISNIMLMPIFTEEHTILDTKIKPGKQVNKIINELISKYGLTPENAKIIPDELVYNYIESVPESVKIRDIHDPKFLEIYNFYKIILPVYKIFFEEDSHKDVLEKLENFSSFTYGNKQGITIATIITELLKNKKHVHPSILKIIEYKDKKSYLESIEKLKKKSKSVEVIEDCIFNSENIMYNPYDSKELKEKYPDLDPALSFRKVMDSVLAGNTEEIPSKLLAHLNKIINTLNKYADENKIVIFTYFAYDKWNPNHAQYLSDLYRRIYYKKHYNKDLQQTSVEDQLNFSGEEIIVSNNGITEYLDTDISSVQDLIEYIFRKNGNKNSENVARGLIDSAINGNIDSANKLLYYTSAMTKFNAQLEQFGLMTKNHHPNVIDGHFDYDSFYGGLNILQSISELMEDKYLKEIGLAKIEEMFFALKNKLGIFMNKEHYDYISKYVNTEFTEDAKEILLEDKKRLFDILRIDLKSEILKMLLDSGSFSRIEEKEVHSAGIISPKILRRSFNLKDSTLGEINSDYFKYFSKRKARYQLSDNLIEKNNLGNISKIYPDFVVRSFNRTYNILLVNYFSEVNQNKFGNPVPASEILIKDGYRMVPNTNEKMYRYDLENSMIFRNELGVETIVIKSSKNSISKIEDIITSDNTLVSVEPFLTNCDNINLDELKLLLSTINTEVNSLATFEPYINLAIQADNLDIIRRVLLNAYTDNKKRYEAEFAESVFIAFLASQNIIALRIPTQSLQSIMSQTVKGLTNEKGNDVFITRWQFWLQGSDLDIDKAYLLGRNFDKYGRFIHWSPLARTNTSGTFEESLDLPLPLGYKLVPANQAFKESGKYKPIIYQDEFTSNFKLNNLITDYLVILESLKSDPKLIESTVKNLAFKYQVYGTNLPLRLRIKIISEIIKETNKSEYFSIDAKFLKVPQVNTLIKLINKHNLYKPTPEAYQNLNVTRMIQINEDSRNEISAYSPIDDAMALFIDPLKSKKQRAMNIDDGLSVAFGTKGNSTGKDDVGVSANSEKVYYNSLGYHNKHFRSSPPKNEDELLNSRHFKLNKIILSYPGEDGKIIRRRHIIAGISDIKMSSLVLDFYNLLLLRLDPKDYAEKYRVEIPNDNASTVLSSITSLSTDNAKTAALDKMNGDSELLCIHTYLTCLGFDPKKVIVGYTTSPIFTKLANLIDTNILLGEDGHITRNTWDILLIWAKNQGILNEYYQLYNLYYNAQELKNIAGILKINQGVKNSDNEEIQIAFNFESALKNRNLLYADLITKSGIVNKEALINEILKNSGFFNYDDITDSEISETDIQQMLEMRNFLSEKIDKVHQLILDNNIDPNKPISMSRFFTDEHYKLAIIEIYDLIKATVNTYDFINETPHFYAMLQKYSETMDQLCELIAEKRFIRKIAPSLYDPKIIANNSKSRNDDEGYSTRAYKTPQDFNIKLIPGALRAYNNWKLLTFFKLISPTYNFKTVIENHNYNIDFSTDKGIHEFVNFVNNALLTKLINSDLTLNMDTSFNNGFLLSLELNNAYAKEGKPFYGLNINLRLLSNSDINDKTLLFSIQLGFDQISDLTLLEVFEENNENDFPKDMTVGEILFLYNLIMRQVAPKISGFTGLFSKLFAKDNNIVDKFESFEQDINKGNIPINISNKIFMALLFSYQTRSTGDKMVFRPDNSEIIIRKKTDKGYESPFLFDENGKITVNNSGYIKFEKLIQALKSKQIKVTFNEKCV